VYGTAGCGLQVSGQITNVFRNTGTENLLIGTFFRRPELLSLELDYWDPAVVKHPPKTGVSRSPIQSSLRYRTVSK